MPNISQETAENIIVALIFVSGMGMIYLSFEKQQRRYKQMQDKTYYLTDKRYYLSARLGDDYSACVIWAKNDTDAIAVGAIRVVALAHGFTEPWANGEILLKNPKGEIISRMEAK